MVLQVASPAKLNLFLAVGPKDAAGYHPIRTIFQAIGLQDEVTIDVRDVGELFNVGGLPTRDGIEMVGPNPSPATSAKSESGTGR